ncbi:MAG: sn-glycerol-3-phosphate transport system permease protein UgpA [Alphaproteobacteria bacterium MarineAlpha5_Bin6]|nr:MAG: sn-glycerol-3-phosphate transport system permease protein UgpA [Alphaproteobacteria bacterium MarineAlpha5_Bin6]|tara:strand:- start:398 stop:1240 length:843 start_codon:yes stop_codon:yes gene_type:complete
MKQTPYLFLLPCILILAFTSLYPICYSIYYSFFNWRWGDEKDFIGLSNYFVLLTDKEFWIIIKNTFVFAFFACLFEIIIGVLLAIYIDRIKFGSTIIRTLLLIPLMVSGISVTMLFKVILDNMFGIIPYFLSFVGIKSNFFGSYDAAMPTIIGLDVWWQTSFVFIIILAGLKSIPNEPIEAAKMDGATEWDITRYIRLPMIRSLLFLVLIFRSIDTLKVFDIIWGTTGGGPGLATEALQTYAYRVAYSFLEMSKSMTIMVMFSIVLIILTMIYSKFNKDI